MVVIISATGQFIEHWIGTHQAQKDHVALLKQDVVLMRKREKGGGRGDNYENTRLHILAECTMWRLQRVF